MCLIQRRILARMCSAHSEIQTDIQVLESSMKAITGNFVGQEKEIKRQNEIMYDVKFKIMDLETRIAKMRGAAGVISPETLSKLKQLQELNGKTEQKHQHIQQQVTVIQDNLRKLTTSLKADQMEYERLMEKVQAAQIDCDGGLKQLVAVKRTSHERLVEHSLMKMRVQQMEQMLQRQLHKVLDVEKQRAALELEIGERLVDGRTKMQLLLMQRKHLVDERAQLKADIAERRMKIDALRARYELARDVLGQNEDGTAVSAVQVRIQTAQEKEMLLKEGSDLNEKVITAEKDIKAIENTLVLMNVSNDRYKRNVGHVEVSEDDIQMYNDLTDRCASVLTNSKSLKASLEMKLKLIHDLNRQLIAGEKDLEDISRVRMDSNDALMKIHKEIFEQKSKIERAQRELKMARKAMIAKVVDREYIRNFERDLNAKELEERNTSALQQLADLVDSVMGMGPVVTKHLYEKGLSMPAVPGGASRGADGMSEHSSAGRESNFSFNLGYAREEASKLSQRTFPESLSASSTPPSDKSRKSQTKSGRDGVGPSVIMLDFPGDNSKPTNSRRF